MATMSELGFTWYGRENNGGWRFDVRLRDPAVRAAQLERWSEERKERCRALIRRPHCKRPRKLKLLRRIYGGRQQLPPDVQQLDGQLMNRHARRAL